MGMACFHPLARRCFPKTRSLRPRSRLLTGLLNMGSQSSHHQSLQLPREEQKSPTKGRDGVSTMKKFYCSFWAHNVEKVERKDSRKAWEEICKALNKRQGLKTTIDQCQRKVKHLKNQSKEKKDWNRRQSGGNLRKSPHYDIIDSVLGCRDIITCNNVEQAGTQAAQNSRSSENSPETSSAEAPSSSSSAGCITPTTAVCSVARRRERKKVKGQKRPACVDDSNSEDDTVGEAIKKLATEGEQMASVMERMQDSQAQQIQLMSQLVRCFNKYMENNKKE